MTLEELHAVHRAARRQHPNYALQGNEKAYTMIKRIEQDIRNTESAMLDRWLAENPG